MTADLQRAERLVEQLRDGGPVNYHRVIEVLDDLIRETTTRRTNTMPSEEQPPASEQTSAALREHYGPVPAGLGAQSFEQALATTIELPPRETSGLRCVRAESFRQDNDGDVMVKPFGMALEVAIDDPLALLAVTMAAIKFGHGPEMLAAAQKLVADFGKEPHR